MDSDIALWGLCYTISIVVFLFMGLYFAAFVAGVVLYMGLRITGN